MQIRHSTYFLLFFVFISSCSIQKRKYLSGYYLSLKHSPVAAFKTPDQNRITRQPHSFQSKTHELIAEKNETILENTSISHFNSEKKNIQTKKIYQIKTDSCDVIIFRDGTEKPAKVLEITPAEVKYKRCDFIDGPIIAVRKSEIFMIKYSNGTKEVFKQEINQPISKNENFEKLPVRSNERYNTTKEIAPNATLGFILGLISLLILFLPISVTSNGTLALIVLSSIVSAIVSRALCKDTLKKLDSEPDRYKGRALAITGMTLAWITISIYLILIYYILFHK